MKKRLAAALLLSTLASCAAPTVGLEARYGPVNIGGKAGVEAGGITAENSVEALGISDDDGTPSLRGDFKWGSPHLTFNLQRSNHDGTGLLEAELSQGGVTIPVGSVVDTKMDLGLYTGYLTFDFIPGDAELGLGLGVVGLDLDFASTDRLTSSTVATEQMLPVPVLAARAGISFWRADLEALGGIMQWSSGGDKIGIVDLDATGRIRILGDGDRATGWLTLGFRYTNLDLEYQENGDDVRVDLDVTGPYIGVRVSF